MSIGRGGRAFPRGTWVQHVRGPDWHAMELGAIRTFANGSKGGTYWSVSPGLPGIFLGRLYGRTKRRTDLVTVLWMGRVLLCNLSDLKQYEPC